MFVGQIGRADRIWLLLLASVVVLAQGAFSARLGALPSVVYEYDTTDRGYDAATERAVRDPSSGHSAVPGVPVREVSHVVPDGLVPGDPYDPSTSLVAPTSALNLGRFADDTFYDVISTRAGNLEVLAEVSVSGRTLTLSDIAVYGADGDLVNQVGGPAILAVRNALATEAADAGFDTLRITGVRVASSSSTNPGHLIDRTIDLERFRR